MTFGTARDLSLQVVAIPMTSFGMLMNSPHSEFQRISPQKRRSLPRYAIPNHWSLADFRSLFTLDECLAMTHLLN
jgi:hypothetical protein